jgi:probable FeS assembly SUF system protein SufT
MVLATSAPYFNPNFIMPTLIRDCEATLIPSGEEVLLQKSSIYSVKQALGESVTLANELGLFRVAKENLDALGEDGATLAAQLDAQAAEAEDIDHGNFSEDQLWDALKKCYDPEIPVNIVDLGLIYDLQHEEQENGQHNIHVKMTLTAQGCGMGPVIADDARQNLEALAPVSTANVEIVWEPAWTPHMISEVGRQKLGM